MSLDFEKPLHTRRFTKRVYPRIQIYLKIDISSYFHTKANKAVVTEIAVDVVKGSTFKRAINDV